MISKSQLEAFAKAALRPIPSVSMWLVGGEGWAEVTTKRVLRGDLWLYGRRYEAWERSAPGYLTLHFWSAA